MAMKAHNALWVGFLRIESNPPKSGTCNTGAGSIMFFLTMGDLIDVIRALPSLYRETPSATSEHFLGLIGSTPIPPSSSLLAFPFN